MSEDFQIHLQSSSLTTQKKDQKYLDEFSRCDLIQQIKNLTEEEGAAHLEKMISRKVSDQAGNFLQLKTDMAFSQRSQEIDKNQFSIQINHLKCLAQQLSQDNQEQQNIFQGLISQVLAQVVARDELNKSSSSSMYNNVQQEIKKKQFDSIEDYPPRSKLFLVVPKDANLQTFEQELSKFSGYQSCKTDLVSRKGIMFTKFETSSQALEALEDIQNNNNKIGGCKVKAMLATPKTNQEEAVRKVGTKKDGQKYGKSQDLNLSKADSEESSKNLLLSLPGSMNIPIINKKNQNILINEPTHNVKQSKKEQSHKEDIFSSIKDQLHIDTQQSSTQHGTKDQSVLQECTQKAAQITQTQLIHIEQQFNKELKQSKLKVANKFENEDLDTSKGLMKGSEATQKESVGLQKQLDIASQDGVKKGSQQAPQNFRQNQKQVQTVQKALDVKQKQNQQSKKIPNLKPMQHIDKQRLFYVVSKDVTKNEVFDLFNKYEGLLSFELKTQKKVQQSKGYGYVLYNQESQALEVIKNLNYKQFPKNSGMVIKVMYAEAPIQQKSQKQLQQQILSQIGLLQQQYSLLNGAQAKTNQVSKNHSPELQNLNEPLMQVTKAELQHYNTLTSQLQPNFIGYEKQYQSLPLSSPQIDFMHSQVGSVALPGLHQVSSEDMYPQSQFSGMYLQSMSQGQQHGKSEINNKNDVFKNKCMEYQNLLNDQNDQFNTYNGQLQQRQNSPIASQLYQQSQLNQYQKSNSLKINHDDQDDIVLNRLVNQLNQQNISNKQNNNTRGASKPIAFSQDSSLNLSESKNLESIFSEKPVLDTCNLQDKIYGREANQVLAQNFSQIRYEADLGLQLENNHQRYPTYGGHVYGNTSLRQESNDLLDNPQHIYQNKQLLHQNYQQCENIQNIGSQLDIGSTFVYGFVSTSVPQAQIQQIIESFGIQIMSINYVMNQQLFVLQVFNNIQAHYIVKAIDDNNPLKSFGINMKLSLNGFSDFNF